MNSFNVDLLTVLGVLAGLSALLFMMAALDPTNDRRPAHRADRDLAVPQVPRTEQPARGAGAPQNA